MSLFPQNLPKMLMYSTIRSFIGLLRMCTYRFIIKQKDSVVNYGKAKNC